MNRLTKIRSTIIACATTAAALVALAPGALAADGGDDVDGTVTSVRAFPKTQTVDQNLFDEAVATDVEEDATWDIDELEVPKTESTAEKQARLAEEQRQVQERAAREAEAEQAAQAAATQTAAAQAATAQDTQEGETSRSQAREKPDVALSNIAPPDSKTASALVSYAMQFQGKVPYVYGGNTPAGWDCSGFVQYVFSQFGIGLPHESGAQSGVGTFVGHDLSNAKPGDIIATNGKGHAGIYIGNGLVINATVPHSDPSQDTVVSPIGWVFPNGYQVRRVL